MRKNIRQAYQALLSGKSFRTDNGSLSVNDGVIYSYKMPIGWLVNGNHLDVTTEKAPSRTTSCHINGLRVLSSI